MSPAESVKTRMHVMVTHGPDSSANERDRSANEKHASESEGLPHDMKKAQEMLRADLEATRWLLRVSALFLREGNVEAVFR